jgi:NADPH-dependent curcumin reductase CurA
MRGRMDDRKSYAKPVGIKKVRVLGLSERVSGPF